ncbi:hypothetical protein WBG78_24860 [Chryseolinea sp. T2]|uniref:hypothetical protein n=1 Tax=Chryseolinea sp. T2 TaxID=3129255 RepID=UPI0030772457
MALVEIYRNQEAIDAELTMRTSKVAKLQSLYSNLKTLGVTSPTMTDIRDVINNEAGAEFLKTLAVRGKTFTVGGLLIDPKTIVLNPTIVSAIKLFVAQRRDIDLSFYELVEILDEADEPTGEFQVALVADALQRIETGHITKGSELCLEVVQDVEELATAVNAIITKLAAGVHTGMRSPENWMLYNSLTQTWSVNIPGIAHYMKAADL